MDPFSLATGIFTLLGACVTASKTFAKIRRLQQAPGLLQAINNEISDLQLILLNMNDHLRTTRSRESVLPNIDQAMFRLCNSIIDQTKDKILEVDSLIQYRVLIDDHEVGSRVSRFAFVRYHSELVKLQAELRECRQKIADVGGMLGIRDISRIEVILSDIQSHDLSTLARSQARMERILQLLLNAYADVPGSSHDLRPSERPHDSGESELSAIRVTVSPLLTSDSPRKCTCFHQETSMRMRTFLGTLFLGYTTLPAVSQDKSTCLYDHTAGLRVAYFFPLWFIKYAIYIEAQFRKGCTIQCALSFIQIIPQDHVALEKIQHDDVEALKVLLTPGRVSIQAQLGNGASLLHVRCSF